MNRHRASLQKAGDSLPQQTAQIRQAIAEIKAFDPAARDYIAPVTAGLGRIETALKSNQEQVKELQNLAAQLSNAGKQIEVMNSMAATGRTVTTIAAIENASTPGTVVWTDASGKPTSCALSIKLGKIRRAVEVKNLDVTCGTGDAVESIVRPGDSSRLTFETLRLQGKARPSSPLKLGRV